MSPLKECCRTSTARVDIFLEATKILTASKAHNIFPPATILVHITFYRSIVANGIKVFKVLCFLVFNLLEIHPNRSVYFILIICYRNKGLAQHIEEVILCQLHCYRLIPSFSYRIKVLSQQIL